MKISSNAANSPLTIVVAGTGVSGPAHSVSLSWGASSTSGIVGYYLYRSTTPVGSGFARLVASPLTALQYTDGSVQSGKTYYYEVTAVNSAGLESASTPEATAVIPEREVRVQALGGFGSDGSIIPKRVFQDEGGWHTDRRLSTPDKRGNRRSPIRGNVQRKQLPFGSMPNFVSVFSPTV